MDAVQDFLLDTADAVVQSFDLSSPWKAMPARTPKVRYVVAMPV